VAAALAVFGAGASTDTASTSEGTDVVPGYRIELPRDEGSHPQFKLEWWYLTGWLEDSTGKPLGFQFTFFRLRKGIDQDNPSKFALRQCCSRMLQSVTEARNAPAPREVRPPGLWFCRRGGGEARRPYR
jgi:hypothetical protein